MIIMKRTNANWFGLGIPYMHFRFLSLHPGYCSMLLYMTLRLTRRYHYRSIIRCLNTGSPTADSVLTKATGGRIDQWMQFYEDFVGLTEVREAQESVIQAEKQFQESQARRRNLQQRQSEIQIRLKSVIAELEKTSRGTDTYVELVMKENAIIKEETDFENRMEEEEKNERQDFAKLSSAVRESHERERARAERMKYWSIIGSIIGAFIGITGTTINNHLRMKELRNIVGSSADTSKEYKSMIIQLSSAVQSQRDQVDKFLTNIKSSVQTTAGKEITWQNTTNKASKHSDEREYDLKEQTQQILSSLKQQEVNLDKEMKEIRNILSTGGRINDGDSNVVYVGPEMKDLLSETESNLEWKIKMNALGTVVFIYGAIALTLPVVFSFFKGS